MNKQPIKINESKNIDNHLIGYYMKGIGSYVERKDLENILNEIFLVMTINERRKILSKIKRCEYFIQLMDTHKGNRKKVHTLICRKFGIRKQNAEHACDPCEKLYKKRSFRIL